MKKISKPRSIAEKQLGTKPMSVWLRHDTKLIHTHGDPLQKLAYAVIASALDSIANHKLTKYKNQAHLSYAWLKQENCEIMCDALDISHTGLISFVDQYIEDNDLYNLVNKSN